MTELPSICKAPLPRFGNVVFATHERALKHDRVGIEHNTHLPNTGVHMQGGPDFDDGNGRVDHAGEYYPRA